MLRAILPALAILTLSVSVAFAQRPCRPADPHCTESYRGRLSANPLHPDSVANPVGRYGSTISPESINNPLSRAGQAANSVYGTDGLILRSEDGRYLGRLNRNPYDPESVANPYGRYGSPYSPDSIRNPLGRYGSAISPESVNNPLATRAPRIFESGPASSPAQSWKRLKDWRE